MSETKAEVERDSAIGGWQITVNGVCILIRDSFVIENFPFMLEHSEKIIKLKKEKMEGVKDE